MTKAEINRRIGDMIDRADRRWLAHEITEARYDRIVSVLGKLRRHMLRNAEA